MPELQKTRPETALALVLAFGAATLTGLGATLIFYFSNLQGWLFTQSGNSDGRCSPAAVPRSYFVLVPVLPAAFCWL